MIRIGCCGFQTSQKVYYQNFNLIEIQQTFYKLPMLKTVLRWRKEAPKEFIFTLKAWQLITHEPYQPTYKKHGLNLPESMWKNYGSFRPTQEVFTAWEKTLAIARGLEAPVVVFQCPAQFTPTPVHIENMRSFFRQAKRDHLIFAWEPRGDWPANQIRSLCSELNLIHCVDPFLRLPVTGDPAYFRMHGGADYSYRFTEADFAQLQYVCEEHQDAYCLFNNVEMWKDAHRFRDFLIAQGVSVS